MRIKQRVKPCARARARSKMPTFLETVEEQFGSRDLYEVLQVDKSAEDADLRRAYRRLSLRVHPDRASPEEVTSATEKFQVPDGGGGGGGGSIELGIYLQTVE